MSLQRTATHAATHCNTHCNALQQSESQYHLHTVMIHIAATHCNTRNNALQHTLHRTATVYIARSSTHIHESFYFAAHCNTRCNALQCTAMHCNALQHTATHFNVLQQSKSQGQLHTIMGHVMPRRTVTHNATHYNTHCTHTAPYCNSLNRKINLTHS